MKSLMNYNYRQLQPLIILLNISRKSNYKGHSINERHFMGGKGLAEVSSDIVLFFELNYCLPSHKVSHGGRGQPKDYFVKLKWPTIVNYYFPIEKTRSLVLEFFPTHVVL